MLRALLFLDRTPAAYWLLVGGLLTLAAGLAVLPADPMGKSAGRGAGWGFGCWRGGRSAR